MYDFYAYSIKSKRLYAFYAYPIKSITGKLRQAFLNLLQFSSLLLQFKKLLANPLREFAMLLKTDKIFLSSC
jgi:hypothetical protein